jgi:hypothetical protein
MTYENADVAAWLVGLILLAAGCGFQWGWPAALIAVGAIFSLWPLAKNFASR